MKPSTELFDLIQSLSKSEKRFFKLSSSLQSGDKNYLKIFDVIDKQTEYKESELKEIFKEEIFIKHFPSEKNHLYKLILKSLRSYHADNSVNSILKQEIKNIEILYNKVLFSECNKFLMRAKRVAIEYEKFYFLFELISWEKLLLEEAFEDGQFTKDLDTLIKEEQGVIQKLRNLAAYHVLYSKINYVFRSGGFVRGDADKNLVEEIISHPLIIGKNTALSDRAATICYHTQGFCQMAKGNFQLALKKFLKVKLILDNNEQIRKDLVKRYVRTLGNIMICHIDLNQFEKAREVISELKMIGESGPFKRMDIQLRIFRDCCIGELKICNATGDFEVGVKTVEEILSELGNYESKMHKEQELRFFYYVAYIYFGAGEFSKALFWLNKVLNDNEPTLRQDIYSYARLFNLIIHFELGNFDLLEYITKSTQRYLHKRNRDYEFERLVIQYIRKLIRVNNVIDRKEIFQQFKESMLDITQSSNDQIVLRYFNYLMWIDSKTENLSFAECIRKTV